MVGAGQRGDDPQGGAFGVRGDDESSWLLAMRGKLRSCLPFLGKKRGFCDS